MSGDMGNGGSRQPRPPRDTFDFTLVILDDAGRPHLAVPAQRPPAATDPLPGSRPE
jgi:hypothetical protein